MTMSRVRPGVPCIERGAIPFLIRCFLLSGLMWTFGAWLCAACMIIWCALCVAVVPDGAWSRLSLFVFGVLSSISRFLLVCHLFCCTGCQSSVRCPCARVAL